MSNIQLTAKLAIQDGKLEEFKNLASQCIALVKENEKGKTCSQYDWFFSADEKECHVRETYIDSNAVLAHMGNVGEKLGQLLQISSLSGEIYGDLSEEVESAITPLGIKTYSFYSGI